MNIANDTMSAAVPVLIVGGGPVGLSLALELAYRKIPSILIEQTDGVVRLSKMGHVSVRSMEHCRRWGIADQVRNCGFPHDYPHDQIFCTSLNGQHIGTIALPSQADDDDGANLSPEKKQRCPQLWFDPILARKAASDPLITLSFNTRLTSFVDRGDGVIAEVEDTLTGEKRQIAAQYLVGCDGGASAVRQALGIVFEGEMLTNSVGIYFTAVDLAKYHDMGRGTRYWMIGEEGTWGNLTVVDGKDVWRLTISGSQEEVDMSKFDSDAWLRRCLGREDIPYSITATLPWRRYRLVANGYGRGRVFLAGDACHLNAPNGGFGMNTGLGDSVDIGWKLQGVIDGWASPDILSTYEAERRPVAQRNVDAAARNFSLTKPKLSYDHVEDEGEQGNATRAALCEALVRDTTPEWKTEGVHLGYRYEGSPLIVGDGTPEPFDDLTNYTPVARPGHRAPHFWVREGVSVLDLLTRTYVLLQFGENNEGVSEIGKAAEKAGIPFEVVRIDNDEGARLYERRLVLVRPDGHVAWRGDALDMAPDELLATVSGWRVRASGDKLAPLAKVKG